MRTLTAGPFVVTESLYRAGEVLPRHYHDHAFLSFASRGSFEETLRTRALRCETFDVIARPAGEVHSNRYDAKGTACVLVALSGRFSDLTISAALPRAVAAPIAVRIAREFRSADEVSPLIIEGLVLELIGGALRPEPRGARWLAAARDYIHANASRPLTTRAIANVAGVHPTTLSRAFRATYRCTPGEYLRRVRIETAIAALTTTTATIADIAVATGFYDQSHLTNALKRHTRLTPADYRRW
jgi:AraC family transcriptional regulator